MLHRVFLGIEITDDVDPTALATFVLALATLVTVLVATRSLKYTKDALVQTQKGVDLSRHEVEEAHRPVVVPIVDATQKIRPDSPESPSLGPQVMLTGVFWVPIQNIGSGPALSIDVAIELLADTATIEDRNIEGAVTGLGVNRHTPVELHAHDLAQVPDFRITISYRDIADKPLRTSASYSASQKRYDNIVIPVVGIEDG